MTEPISKIGKANANRLTDRHTLPRLIHLFSCKSCESTLAIVSNRNPCRCGSVLSSFRSLSSYISSLDGKPLNLLEKAWVSNRSTRDWRSKIVWQESSIYAESAPQNPAGLKQLGFQVGPPKIEDFPESLTGLQFTMDWLQTQTGSSRSPCNRRFRKTFSEIFNIRRRSLETQANSATVQLYKDPFGSVKPCILSCTSLWKSVSHWVNLS